MSSQIDVDRSLTQLLSLDGRVGVITGAAHGIGHAMARRLSEAGASLMLGDLDVDGLQSSIAGLGDRPSVSIARLDASDPASHRSLASAAVETFGRLDIWINDAGVYPFVALADMTPEQWQRVIDIDLSGYFFGAQAAAAVMDGPGVIVNVPSIAGVRPDGPNLAHYTAAKAGVIGLTKALAVELGSRGIRAMTVAPGFVATEGTAAAREQMSTYVGGDPAEMMATRSPLGRVVAADEVARAALFAVSDLASAMTGSTLLVDAGVVGFG